MLLKDYFELVNYQITEGSTFMWSCFGPNARIIDSWNGDHDGWSADVVFDCQTSTVYQLNVCDYAHNLAYQWINPKWRDAYYAEAKAHNVYPYEAWDGVNYVEIEVITDYFEKARAIIARKKPDTRVSIEISLENDLLLKLAMMAHEKDITLNQLIQNILVDYLKESGMPIPAMKPPA